MRARLPALVVASLALAACSGGGGPSPAGLAYGVPSPATLTYTMGDTTNVDIDAGGQMMQMRMTAEATYGAAFARAADGIEVTMTVESFNARATQPMGGPVNYDGDGLDEPVVFTLDGEGNVSNVVTPNLTGMARQFFTPLSLSYTFFPGLPGGAVNVGDMWTDTVSYSGAEGEGEVTAHVIFTYTAAGDTVVDGQSLAKFTFTGTGESEATGVTSGVDFSQSVTSEIEGHVLWDMSAGVMVEHFLDTDSRGDMEVSMAPFPLGLRARQQQTIKRAGGM